MTALAADRNTPEAIGQDREGLLGANQAIFAGAILMRNASGHLIEGATATGSVGAGRAEERLSSTTAGVTRIRYKPGTFRFANSAAGDLIAEADIGTVCYIVDDQTVAKTSGTNTRSPAGIVDSVDAQGVWVRFDEALTVTEMDMLEADGGAAAVLDRAVVGFEDLADAGGQPVDGSGEWRARLLEYAFVRTALIRVFYSAQAGLRAGNSDPSAAPGRGAS